MITKVDRKYLEINSPEEINLSDKPNSNCKIEIKKDPDLRKKILKLSSVIHLFAKATLKKK